VTVGNSSNLTIKKMQRQEEEQPNGKRHCGDHENVNIHDDEVLDPVCLNEIQELDKFSDLDWMKNYNHFEKMWIRKFSLHRVTDRDALLQFLIAKLIPQTVNLVVVPDSPPVVSIAQDQQQDEDQDEDQQHDEDEDQDQDQDQDLVLWRPATLEQHKVIFVIGVCIRIGTPFALMTVQDLEFKWHIKQLDDWTKGFPYVDDYFQFALMDNAPPVDGPGNSTYDVKHSMAMVEHMYPAHEIIAVPDLHEGEMLYYILGFFMSHQKWHLLPEAFTFEHVELYIKSMMNIACSNDYVSWIQYFLPLAIKTGREADVEMYSQTSWFADAFYRGHLQSCLVLANSVPEDIIEQSNLGKNKDLKYSRQRIVPTQPSLSADDLTRAAAEDADEDAEKIFFNFYSKTGRFQRSSENRPAIDHINGLMLLESYWHFMVDVAPDGWSWQEYENVIQPRQSPLSLDMTQAIVEYHNNGRWRLIEPVMREFLIRSAPGIKKLSLTLQEFILNPI
jgi:hypothetical protein